MSNFVYIGTSLDGFIADKEGGLDWLELIPNPENSDLGFNDFLKKIDCLVMGRITYETVAAMDIDWPYSVPVFVLSHTLKSIPGILREKVEIIQGDPKEITSMLKDRGYLNLYIDGGKTIQSFLEKDMIDEMIITRLPVLLGDGIPLFSSLSGNKIFEHVETKVLLSEMVMSHYKRKR